MMALMRQRLLKSYGSYALEEKESKKVIGIAGLDYPNDWPQPEMQWGLHRQYWGKGFVGEAVRAVKRMSEKYLPDMSLISLIRPHNINSINLAKWAGTYFEKEYFSRNDTWHIYRQTKEPCR